MKNYRFGLALVIAIGVLAFPLPATATGGVADPGFSYVDVNNDGLYNPADGDFGPVDPLILADGHFDTSQSEGPYQAPCWPVSLVISRAQLPPLTVPLSLKAGVNLIVYGRLKAPTISLQACRNVDLSTSNSEFGTQMTVDAGRDVILDGAAITGDDPSSQLYVSGCGDISARKFANVSTSISTGSLVSLCAGGCMYLDGAQIATSKTGASVTLNAGGALEAVDGTNITTLTAGDVVARSQCNLVRLENDSIDGKTLLVDANCNASVTSSVINTSGATTIQANGSVDGISAVISCSCLKVSSCACVDLDSSNISASPGGIEVTGRGDVTANSVTWTASTKIAVTSTCGNIFARLSRMTVTGVPNPIAFYAGGGLIDVTGSVFIGTVTYGPNGVMVLGP
jgi:hypothetical protein